jgi:hypothetical protein
MLLPTNKLIVLHPANADCLRLSLFLIVFLNSMTTERRGRFILGHFVCKTSFAKPKLQDWHIGANCKTCGNDNSSMRARLRL